MDFRNNLRNDIWSLWVKCEVPFDFSVVIYMCVCMCMYTVQTQKIPIYTCNEGNETTLPTVVKEEMNE